MFIIVLRQHVSILAESSTDPSKNTDPYLAMFMYTYFIISNNMYKNIQSSIEHISNTYV